MSGIDELYRQYRARLTRVLRRFGDEDADDNAQEALIAAWKNLDKIEPGSEWPYVRKTGRNFALNRIRSAEAERRGGGGIVGPMDENTDAEDETRSSEEALIAREEIAAFRTRFNAAMAQLDPETQECLVLRRRGFHSRQIAEKLGTSAVAVRSRLSRASKLIHARVGAPPSGVEWIELLGDDDDHQE